MFFILDLFKLIGLIEYRHASLTFQVSHAMPAKIKKDHKKSTTLRVKEKQRIFFSIFFDKSFQMETNNVQCW